MSEEKPGSTAMGDASSLTTVNPLSGRSLWGADRPVAFWPQEKVGRRRAAAHFLRGELEPRGLYSGPRSFPIVPWSGASGARLVEFSRIALA